MINRESLLTLFDNIPTINGICTEPVVTILDVKEIIKAVPEVEAVPVVHGKWLGKRYNYETYETEIVPYNPLSFEDLDGWTCSVCGGQALLNGHEESVPSNYCPACGAKMDFGLPL